MPKPTVREILTDFDITDPKHEMLAERVEKVLAICNAETRHNSPRAVRGFAGIIISVLDGE